MPDITSQPLVPPPAAGMWPQAPAPQQSLLQNPGAIIDLVTKLQQSQMLQQELKSRAAIGQAYQGAMQDDGTVDPNKLAAGLRGNPDAVWGLQDATTKLLQQQGLQTELRQRQDLAARSVLSTLPNNATDEELRHYAVTLARAGIPPALTIGHLDYLMNKKGRARADAIATLKNTAIGPAGTSTRVPGPPSSSGAPTSISTGEANYQVGGMPTGLPTGEEVPLTESAKRASQLQASGATTAQYHADLGNLLQLSKAVEIGGPTVEIEKRLEVAQRLGLPSTLSARQLSSAEEFDKIASQLAIRQTQAFYGSDAALHTVVGANPNLSTSAFGREGIINMLQGQQDAVDVLRNGWLRARAQGVPANQHDAWVNEQAKLVDPRLFQFSRLSAAGQRTFWSQLDPADIPTFKAKYMQAVKNGWVKPPKPAQPGAGQ